MNAVERFQYSDRNPASAGMDLMPDLPITLRGPAHSIPATGLVIPAIDPANCPVCS